MFLLVPAYPGSPGQKAGTVVCLCESVCECVFTCMDSLTKTIFSYHYKHYKTIKQRKKDDTYEVW